MMRYNREDPWDGLDLWRSWLPTFAASIRVTQQLHRQVRPDARLPDGAVDPNARQARHRQLLDLRLPLQHGRDGASVPHRRRRRVRGGAGDHVRHQPRAHRRMVCRPGPRVRALGHHRRHLCRGHGGNHEAGSGQDPHAGPGGGGGGGADRDAVPQHGRRCGDELPDRRRGPGSGCWRPAPGPMANGPWVPSTEQTVENLRWEGHTTKVDLDRVQRIGAHLHTWPNRRDT